jgi:hypothetical protein
MDVPGFPPPLIRPRGAAAHHRAVGRVIVAELPAPDTSGIRA